MVTFAWKRSMVRLMLPPRPSLPSSKIRETGLRSLRRSQSLRQLSRFLKDTLRSLDWVRLLSKVRGTSRSLVLGGSPKWTRVFIINIVRIPLMLGIVNAKSLLRWGVDTTTPITCTSCTSLCVLLLALVTRVRIVTTLLREIGLFWNLPLDGFSLEIHGVRVLGTTNPPTPSR